MKVSVRVKPGSRQEKFEQIKEHEFDAAVRQTPERNAANVRIQQLVAAHYNVPITSVRFVTGVRARKKVFEVVQ